MSTIVRKVIRVHRSGTVHRRKAMYEELHPETPHGANLIAPGVAKLATRESFVEATANAIGKSERSVQRDAERGEALGDDLDAITGRH